MVICLSHVLRGSMRPPFGALRFDAQKATDSVGGAAEEEDERSVTRVTQQKTQPDTFAVELVGHQSQQDGGRNQIR